MNEWKPAIPVDYLDPDTKIGKVLVGKEKGPPLFVRQYDPEIDDKPDCLIIELEDFLKETAKELYGIEKDEIMRLAIHLPGARKLCCHLIESLAESGDKVANRIQFMMRQAIESLEKEG